MADSLMIEISKRKGSDYFTKEVPIEPCPFCGSVALIVSDVLMPSHDTRTPPDAVMCGDCGVVGPSGYGEDSEEMAVRHWNRGDHNEEITQAPWVLRPRITNIGDDDDYPF